MGELLNSEVFKVGGIAAVVTVLLQFIIKILDRVTPTAAQRRAFEHEAETERSAWEEKLRSELRAQIKELEGTIDKLRLELDQVRKEYYEVRAAYSVLQKEHCSMRTEVEGLQKLVDRRHLP